MKSTILKRNTSLKYYQNLYDNIELLDDFKSRIKKAALRVIGGIERYIKIEKITGIPWLFVGTIHEMECNCNFNKQILNGEDWDKKTTLVPKNLGPWNSWEESALDKNSLGRISIYEWNIGRLGKEAEKWNGLGYVYKNKNSPYLWSGSNHGIGSGKYVADGKYDENAVSDQIGVMVIVKYIEKMGFKVPNNLKVEINFLPIIFDKNGENISSAVKEYQKLLNKIIQEYSNKETEPIRVDGWAGKNTSDANYLLTGKYLLKDPRN